jgi:hypothetical protein
MIGDGSGYLLKPVCVYPTIKSETSFLGTCTFNDRCLTGSIGCLVLLLWDHSSSFVWRSTKGAC